MFCNFGHVQRSENLFAINSYKQNKVIKDFLDKGRERRSSNGYKEEKITKIFIIKRQEEKIFSYFRN